MTESLHERLLVASSQRRSLCKVCVFLHTSEKKVADMWRAELRYPHDIIGHQAISDGLRDLGVYIGATSVKSHRRNHERV